MFGCLNSKTPCSKEWIEARQSVFIFEGPPQPSLRRSEQKSVDEFVATLFFVYEKR